MTTNNKSDSEVDEILLQYRAEISQGLNELAGHGTAEEQAETALQALIQEEVTKGSLKALENVLKSSYGHSDYMKLRNALSNEINRLQHQLNKGVEE